METRKLILIVLACVLGLAALLFGLSMLLTWVVFPMHNQPPVSPASSRASIHVLGAIS